MDDLNAGIIRTIGKPDERFVEDPIRMLRVVRHSVRTGFAIEPDTRASILRNASLLGESNRFRLQVEFQKDLDGPAFASVLRLQREIGLLPVVFPDLDAYLEEQDPNPEALFQPHWVWEALSRLDASTEDKDRIRENRVLSLVLPLIEARVTKTYSSLSEARRDSSGLKQLFRDLDTPFAVPRREQERFKIYLTGWMRLIELVEGTKPVPAGFRKKAYFKRVLEWHRFHQAVAGRSEEEIREKVDRSLRAAPRTRRGRPKRKRKKG
jgi:poly(A) polymerase